MIDRCKGFSAGDKESYTDRGIKVCKEWSESFEAFFADMGHRPEGMTLDRIDNDGDYELGNCRWATLRQQANNKRTNRRILFEGRTQTMKQWADEKRLNYVTIKARFKNGWSVIRALTTPTK